jgi:ribosome assembly protein 1
MEQVDSTGEADRTPTVKPDQYWTTLAQLCTKAGGEWADVADRTIAFGPNGAGGCLLIDSRPGSSSSSLRRRMKTIRDHGTAEVKQENTHGFDGYIEHGFQIATFQGPLCAEPIEGIAYFLQSLEIDSDGLEQERS